MTEVNRLKLINDSYHQKIEMVNQLVLDKELLTKQVQELLKEKADIIAKNDEQMRQKEVKNQIKFSNLKKKMMDNINQTQSKVTELNIQYMDVSTKLTLLQNHQLLIQLEYQSQQIDELTSKKEALEKKKKRKIITEIKRIVRAKAINVDTIKRIVPKIITIIIEDFFSYPPN